MLNNVILIGRVTKEPEEKTILNRGTIVTCTLAVDNCDKEKTTSFIPLIIFKEKGVNFMKFVCKGQLIAVQGKLHQKNYERKDGTKASDISVYVDTFRTLERKNKEEDEEVVEVLESIE